MLLTSTLPGPSTKVTKLIIICGSGEELRARQERGLPQSRSDRRVNAVCRKNIPNVIQKLAF